MSKSPTYVSRLDPQFRRFVNVVNVYPSSDTSTSNDDLSKDRAPSFASSSCSEINQEFICVDAYTEENWPPPQSPRRQVSELFLEYANVSSESETSFGNDNDIGITTDTSTLPSLRHDSRDLSNPEQPDSHDRIGNDCFGDDTVFWSGGNDEISDEKYGINRCLQKRPGVSNKRQEINRPPVGSFSSEADSESSYRYCNETEGLLEKFGNIEEFFAGRNTQWNENTRSVSKQHVHEVTSRGLQDTSRKIADSFDDLSSVDSEFGYVPDVIEDGYSSTSSADSSFVCFALVGNQDDKRIKRKMALKHSRGERQKKHRYSDGDPSRRRQIEDGGSDNGVMACVVTGISGGPAVRVFRDEDSQRPTISKSRPLEYLHKDGQHYKRRTKGGVTNYPALQGSQFVDERTRTNNRDSVFALFASPGNPSVKEKQSDRGEKKCDAEKMDLYRPQDADSGEVVLTGFSGTYTSSKLPGKDKEPQGMKSASKENVQSNVPRKQLSNEIHGDNTLWLDRRQAVSYLARKKSMLCVSEDDKAHRSFKSSNDPAIRGIMHEDVPRKAVPFKLQSATKREVTVKSIRKPSSKSQRLERNLQGNKQQEVKDTMKPAVHVPQLKLRQETDQIWPPREQDCTERRFEYRKDEQVGVLSKQDRDAKMVDRTLPLESASGKVFGPYKRDYKQDYQRARNLELKTEQLRKEEFTGKEAKAELLTPVRQAIDNTIQTCFSDNGADDNKWQISANEEDQVCPKHQSDDLFDDQEAAVEITESLQTKSANILFRDENLEDDTEIENDKYGYREIIFKPDFDVSVKEHQEIATIESVDTRANFQESEVECTNLQTKGAFDTDSQPMKGSCDDGLNSAKGEEIETDYKHFNDDISQFSSSPFTQQIIYTTVTKRKCAEDKRQEALHYTKTKGRLGTSPLRSLANVSGCSLDEGESIIEIETSGSTSKMHSITKEGQIEHCLEEGMSGECPDSDTIIRPNNEEEDGDNNDDDSNKSFSLVSVLKKKEKEDGFSVSDIQRETSEETMKTIAIYKQDSQSCEEDDVRGTFLKTKSAVDVHDCLVEENCEDSVNVKDEKNKRHLRERDKRGHREIVSPLSSSPLTQQRTYTHVTERTTPKDRKQQTRNSRKSESSLEATAARLSDNFRSSQAVQEAIESCNEKHGVTEDICFIAFDANNGLTEVGALGTTAEEETGDNTLPNSYTQPMLNTNEIHGKVNTFVTDSEVGLNSENASQKMIVSNIVLVLDESEKRGNEVKEVVCSYEEHGYRPQWNQGLETVQIRPSYSRNKISMFPDENHGSNLEGDAQKNLWPSTSVRTQIDVNEKAAGLAGHFNTADERIHSGTALKEVFDQQCQVALTKECGSPPECKSSGSQTSLSYVGIHKECQTHENVEVDFPREAFKQQSVECQTELQTNALASVGVQVKFPYFRSQVALKMECGSPQECKNRGSQTSFSYIGIHKECQTHENVEVDFPRKAFKQQSVECQTELQTNAFASVGVQVKFPVFRSQDKLIGMDECCEGGEQLQECPDHKWQYTDKDCQTSPDYDLLLTTSKHCQTVPDSDESSLFSVDHDTVMINGTESSLRVSLESKECQTSENDLDTFLNSLNLAKDVKTLVSVSLENKECQTSSGKTLLSSSVQCEILSARDGKDELAAKAVLASRFASYVNKECQTLLDNDLLRAASKEYQTSSWSNTSGENAKGTDQTVKFFHSKECQTFPDNDLLRAASKECQTSPWSNTSEEIAKRTEQTVKFYDSKECQTFLDNDLLRATSKECQTSSWSNTSRENAKGTEQTVKFFDSKECQTFLDNDLLRAASKECQTSPWSNTSEEIAKGTENAEISYESKECQTFLDHDLLYSALKECQTSPWSNTTDEIGEKSFDSKECETLTDIGLPLISSKESQTMPDDTKTVSELKAHQYVTYDTKETQTEPSQMNGDDHLSAAPFYPTEADLCVQKTQFTDSLDEIKDYETKESQTTPDSELLVSSSKFCQTANLESITQNKESQTLPSGNMFHISSKECQTAPYSLDDLKLLVDQVKGSQDVEVFNDWEAERLTSPSDSPQMGPLHGTPRPTTYGKSPDVSEVSSFELFQSCDDVNETAVCENTTELACSPANFALPVDVAEIGCQAVLCHCGYFVDENENSCPVASSDPQNRAAMRVSEGMQKEQASLIKQLDMLRDMNQKLRDDKDAIEAAHEANKGKVWRQGSQMSKYVKKKRSPAPEETWGNQGSVEASSGDDVDGSHDTRSASLPNSIQEEAEFDGDPTLELVSEEKAQEMERPAWAKKIMSYVQPKEIVEDEENQKTSDDELEEDVFRKRKAEIISSTGRSRLKEVREESDISMSEDLTDENGSASDDRPSSPRAAPVGKDNEMCRTVSQDISEAGVSAVSEPSTPERVFKVVFVGDSGVGKSSFIHRFCHDAWKPSFTATIGVDFQIKTVNLEGRCIALQLWDTAGQERFRSITKQYFRKADGVIVFYDVTMETSFLNIKNWMISVEEGTDDGTAIMIVGNKTDLIEEDSERAVKSQDGKKLAEEYKAIYTETSAKTGDNIQESMAEFSKMLQVREDELMQSVLNLVHKHPSKKKCCK